MRILITGGAGFVGSSLGLQLKTNYPAYDIYALDNLKRRGSELNLPRLKEVGIQFIHGDIRNQEDFKDLPQVDAVIETSAEPSVLAGIGSSPDYLVNTNLAGTIHCLNYAVKHQADFIFLSTSRIYPINGIEKIRYVETSNRFELDTVQEIPGISERGIAENFPLEGYRSLYGASKLSSELMIAEYHHFYGLKTVVNRCGVITGPWQMGKVDQGVVVLWMARHFWKQSLSYIGYNGSGKQVRDILHVSDLSRLVDYQLHHLDSVNGQTFNAGGGKDISVSLKELTALCSKITGNTIKIKKVRKNRQADIAIYITDNSKVKKATEWNPRMRPEKILADIFEWIKKNEKQLSSVLR